LVLYTALISDYDKLAQPLIRDCRRVCFTNLDLQSDDWEIRRVEYDGPDPRRESKRYKLLSHRLFPDEPATVWTDASIKPKREVASAWIAERVVNHDIAVPRHHARGCFLKEAKACVALGAVGKKVFDQLDEYVRLGMPEDYGLPEAAFLIRRNNPTVSTFNELWWQEIKKHTSRDQISFPFCWWSSGVAVNLMDMDIRHNDMFHVATH
jgi:hypothetical protein